CALGPLAADITAGHHLTESTFGARSPFARMAGIDTVILGLGKPFYRVLTQIHAAEDLLGDRFPLPREFKEVDVTLIGATGEYPYRLRIDATEFDRRLGRPHRMLGSGGLAEGTPRAAWQDLPSTPRPESDERRDTRRRPGGAAPKGRRPPVPERRTAWHRAPQAIGGRRGSGRVRPREARSRSRSGGSSSPARSARWRAPARSRRGPARGPPGRAWR